MVTARAPAAAEPRLLRGLALEASSVGGIPVSTVVLRALRHPDRRRRAAQALEVFELLAELPRPAGRPPTPGGGAC